MKINSQPSQPVGVKAVSSPDSSFNERCLKNQSVFSSFIDLIPSKIYLNPEDHVNWTRFATSDQKKQKGKTTENGNKNTKSENDESEMEEAENNSEEINRVNKFDPRVFKSVSQIFKDFQLMEERVHFLTLLSNKFE